MIQRYLKRKGRTKKERVKFLWCKKRQYSDLDLYKLNVAIIIYLTTNAQSSYHKYPSPNVKKQTNKT